MTAVLDWDYSGLASAYRFRPSYADAALEQALRVARTRPGMRACDVGAGTGNLSVALSERGLRVTAVEPNDDMRRARCARTAGDPSVHWVKAVGEAMPLRTAAFDLVTFGSSLNVVRLEAALRESARILRSGGWLLCLWNHRRLDDPLQGAIEALIRRVIPAYSYGARRADQTGALAGCGWFGAVRRIEQSFVAPMPAGDLLAGWRSHATLRRQAGEQLPAILDGIRGLLPDDLARTVAVPYTTRLWMARRTPTAAEDQRAAS